MKKLFSFILLTFICSCGVQNEEYLYDKDDPEYQIFQQLEIQQCIDGSRIFKELDKTSDFARFGYREGTIFKIEETKSNSLKFAKIVSIEEQTMRLEIRENFQTPKALVYTQQDNKDLLNSVSMGVCLNPQAYKHSSLSSADKLVISSERTQILGSKSSDLNKVTEKYTLDKKIPLILHVFNGEKTIESVISGKRTVSNSSTNYKISEISQSECQQNAICDFSIDTSTKTCYPSIDKDHYQKKGISDLLVNLTSNCK